MDELIYYVIEVDGDFNIPANLLSRPAKDGYYISPNGRMCGDSGQATILDQALAERLKKLTLEKLRARHGPELELEIQRVTARGYGSRGLAKVEKSSEQTRAWCDAQEAT